MAISKIISSSISDNTVVAADVGPNAITASELADDAVDTAAIANDAVTGAKIENNPTIAGNLTVGGNVVIPDGGNIGSASDTNAISINSSGAVTLSSDFVPSTPLSHRNLIINGAMQVAQRGTSATGIGYGTVDRFKTDYNGVDENPTQAQHALTSSDTGPYEEGFRYSFHLTNGNQSSVGVGDRIAVSHLIEAQDVANSGWNYTSSSSYITLSFWCKSSVAQNFYGRLQTSDGTSQNYAFETGSLSANTWTKITKTIPGNSNLQFDNDNNLGLTIDFYSFLGTNKTGTITLDAWGAYNSSIRVPDMTSTWYTTNDATWEITGVQLERGSVATPFEHRSYGDELKRCQRYYQELFGNGYDYHAQTVWVANTSAWSMSLMYPEEMRSTPTGTIVGTPINSNAGTVTATNWAVFASSSWRGCSAMSLTSASPVSIRVDGGTNSSVSAGVAAGLYGGTGCYITLNAEF